MNPRIALRYIENSFNENYSPTIGSAFKTKDLIIQRFDEKEYHIRFNIFYFVDSMFGIQLEKKDSGRLPRFFIEKQLLVNRYIIIGILVYDITNKDTFIHLINWMNDFYEQSPGCPIMIVGNKIDLEEKRSIPRRDVLQFARDNNLQCIECSAKTSRNISSLFETV